MKIAPVTVRADHLLAVNIAASRAAQLLDLASSVWPWVLTRA